MNRYYSSQVFNKAFPAGISFLYMYVALTVTSAYKICFYGYYLLYYCCLGSCVMKASAVKCQSIPSVYVTKIFNLDWHLIDISIATWPTSWLILAQHLVDQVLIECQPRCRSNVDQVSIGCHSRLNQGSIKGINQHSTVDAFSTHDLLPWDKISSTPPNFFKKSTAIPLPILASALMQWARDSLSWHENKSPCTSHSLCDGLETSDRSCYKGNNAITLA